VLTVGIFQRFGLEGNTAVLLLCMVGRTIQRSFIPWARPPGNCSASTDRKRLVELPSVDKTEESMRSIGDTDVLFREGET
jgi:hypothetical protein